MSVIILDYGFRLFVVLLLSFALIVIPYTLILHFLMPRIILDQFFKPPHFGELERSMFTGITYAPMRTIFFMSVIVFPRLGKKRKLTEIYKDTPRWYRIAAKVCLYSYFITFGGSMALLLILGILGLYIQHPST